MSVASVNQALHPDRWWIRLPRLVVGAAIASAIGANTVDAVTGRGEVTVVQLFSYFTILSNLIVAFVLVAGGLVLRRRLPDWWDGLRGAVTFYLLMTGLVYAFVVAPPEEILIWNIGWTGIIEHRFAPMFSLADWALVTMISHSRWQRPLLWLVFPIAYLGYTLVHGLATGWYPYAFVDPVASGSWPAVWANIGVVTLAFLVFAVVLHLIGATRERLSGIDRSRPLPRPR